MKEQLITFDTAKLAKEKGFYIDCRDGYRVDDEGFKEFEEDWWLHLSDHYEKYLKESDFLYGRPTQASLQEWLWDTFSIHVSIIPIKLRDEADVRFQHRVIDFRDAFIDKEVLFEHQYNTTHKEFIDQSTCWEEGLQEALKLIKT